MNFLHLEILTMPQRDFLDSLKEHHLPDSSYLAGGTGIALSIGHRRSLDFDFFTKTQFSPDNALNVLKELGKIKIITKSSGSITIEISNQRVSIFFYPYDLLFQCVDNPWKFSLADPKDIIPMKLSAIAGRGSKKDFIDIYFLLRNYTVEQSLSILEKKFAQEEYSKYHILRSLVYFSDADKEPEPEMLLKFDWENAKKFISEKVSSYIGETCLW